MIIEFTVTVEDPVHKAEENIAFLSSIFLCGRFQYPQKS